MFPICLPGVRGECGRSLRRGKTTEGRTPSQRGRTLRAGDIFYFTCIDEREKLLPLYEKYREQYHCVFQVDLYTREQWLEIMPKAASKASAALWLKSSLGCGRLVVFGDGENDVDLFEAADEAYAVANAADVLKAVGHGVIGANDEDGVARWLDATRGVPRRRRAAYRAAPPQERQGVLPKHSVSGGIIFGGKRGICCLRLTQGPQARIV